MLVLISQHHLLKQPPDDIGNDIFINAQPVIVIVVVRVWVRVPLTTARVTWTRIVGDVKVAMPNSIFLLGGLVP